MGRTAAAAATGRAAVLTKAVVRAAGRLELTQRATAATLGVSEATVSRLARGRTIDPATKEGELALLLVRLYRSLDAMVGGNAEQARAWMHAPNRHLHGTPADLIRSVAGLVRVVEYLDALRGNG